MGTTYLIDTNIISKLFKGLLSQKSLSFISGLAISRQNISVVNRIELLSWKELKGEKLVNIKAFLAEIHELNLTEEIIQETIKIRKNVSIKLPDAIIAATAIVHGLTLLSDNDSDFLKVPRLKYLNPTKEEK